MNFNEQSILSIKKAHRIDYGLEFSIMVIPIGINFKGKKPVVARMFNEFDSSLIVTVISVS